jgi:hypothetical protein
VPVGDRTEDCHWKLGIFYFNPDDVAVIVEKRFGLGYTLNFARLATWTIVFFLIDGPADSGSRIEAAPLTALRGCVSAFLRP